MKSNEASVFVFIASIIIGILISLNIDLGRKSVMVILSAKQYQDAYNLKTKLHTDISDLEEQYKYYSARLDKYKSSSKNKTEVIEEIDKEYKSNSIIIGSIDVHGPGIKLFLNDASTDFAVSEEDYEAKIVHNTDVIHVINDLKNAGAEVISINDQRVTDRTEVYCDGPFLGVNGVKLAAPFNIYAIGNKEILKSYMLDSESWITMLTSPLREVKVEIDESDDITIKANNTQLSHKFMIENK